MDSFLSNPLDAAINGAMGAMKVKLYLYDKTQQWTTSVASDFVNFNTDTVFVYIKVVTSPSGATGLVQLTPHLNIGISSSAGYHLQGNLTSLRQLQLLYFDQSGNSNTHRTLALIYTFS